MTKKNPAAQALRAIPSKVREEQSRINGRKGGRPRVRPPQDPHAVIGHADGTVSYWEAADHRWRTRVGLPHPRDLAKLPAIQRARVKQAFTKRG